MLVESSFISKLVRVRRYRGFAVYCCRCGKPVVFAGKGGRGLHTKT